MSRAVPIDESGIQDYPRPIVPMLPPLSFGLCGGKSEEALPSILDSGEALMSTSGRISIATALKVMEVEQGSQILLPAYNCSSMVDPVAATKFEPVLYKINPDLTVDLADIQSRLSDRTRVLLIVHYFGFPQDTRRIREFCDEHGLLMMEDCAHAFFGDFDGSPPGQLGDCAISSIMKFFPIYDGGCLVSAKYSLEAVELKSGGAWFEIKSLINSLERSVEYNRLRPLNWPLKLLIVAKDWLWSLVKRRRRASDRASSGPGASEGGFAFDSGWMGIRMSHVSRMVMQRASIPRIIARRRANYRYFLDQLGELSGCRPVCPNLPDNIVPYVFPLYVDKPAEVFPQLKTAGVPIFRWEEISPTVCETSDLYSRHLFQLPCHQELRKGEMEWMVGAIKSAVAA